MRGGIWEIILIVLLVLILFGSAKIPAMARNIAQGIKTFKNEVKDEPKKTKKVQSKKVVSKTNKKK
ncbi:MAG: twin-arginine translocase TatA/TatE family subunit [Alphaproteobacteria bacterium]|nr:twin-arginine translocase TatA/TatE family subunit [Alphaproteobacteria bacterium]